jgi:DGQHR domain-containing protein
MPLKVPAIKFVQKKIPMFLTALSVDDLDLFCCVDQWNPHRTATWKGYQRGTIKKKIEKLATYLERPDGILPVAGLLNVRQKNLLNFSDKKSKKPTAGILTIPDGTKLWVVDMQHRIEGIKVAYGNGLLEDFPVPVLIMEGLPDIKEAAQFYVINTNSKRMGVDLTRRLLIEHNLIKELSNVKPWEVKAVKIAIHLNKIIKGNPWYGRIREPESERLKDHVATEKSFVPSLRWLLIAPETRNKSNKDIANFLANYWEGIRTNIPKAFESPRSYLIQKTPGYMAFHRLAPIIFRKYPKRTKDTYVEVFKPLSTNKSLGDKFWMSNNLKGAKRYGTGQSAYSTLSQDLEKKLGL